MIHQIPTRNPFPETHNVHYMFASMCLLGVPVAWCDLSCTFNGIGQLFWLEIRFYQRKRNKYLKKKALSPLLMRKIGANLSRSERKKSFFWYDNMARQINQDHCQQAGLACLLAPLLFIRRVLSLLKNIAQYPPLITDNTERPKQQVAQQDKRQDQFSPLIRLLLYILVLLNA